jgi:chaperonin GroES
MEELKSINQSGIIPTGGHLLVLPVKVEERTAGGIILPQETRDKEQQAATVGTLVEIGASAWTDLDDGKPWAEVGDKVSYAKYAGVSMQGKDNQTYVLINDNDVLAKLLF